MKLCPSCGTRYEDAAKFCQHDGTLLRPAGGRGEDDDPYVGQVLLGQFEVQELIGSGGMGRVYRARQLGFDRPTAVKILHHDLVANQEMVKRFNREARIISRLDHPAIIHVYLFGELPDSNLYLAMEYVDGRSLTELINEGPVPPTRAIHIAVQILSALEEAHSKGVVHRDLKPDNIMLVKRGADPDTVKVLDFGIAKFLGARTMLTQQGLVFGSARYISPEAAAGEDVDERADLYAVGVILYHMLAGVPPFDDPSAVTLLMRHVNDRPPDLLSQPGARAVPPPLGTVVMRALEKDPASRHADAAAMREALIDAAQRGGVALAPELLIAAGSRGPSLPPPAARSEAPAPKEGQAAGGEGSTERYGTSPMYGGRLADPGGPAPSGAGGTLSEPTEAGTPKARSRAPGAADGPPLPATRLSMEALPTTEPVATGSFEDEEEPPRVPRSRAWILLVVIGVIALAAGAVATYVMFRGGGDAQAAGPGAGTSPTAPVQPTAPLVPVPATPASDASAGAPVASEGSDAGAGDGAPPLVAVVPESTDGGAAAGSTEPERGRARRGDASPGGGSGGMPPSATLRVSPRHPRIGAAVRVVATVTPPQALRSARFVISRRGEGAGEPTWRDAESGGEPGLYVLSYTFDRPGDYQITFVARSAHGELRAFADASVSGRVSAGGPTEGGAGPDEPPDPAVTNAHDDKPPDELDDTIRIPPPPAPVPPPSPW